MISREEDQKDPLQDIKTMGVFEMPFLIMNAPEKPLGPGAKWHLERQLGKLRITERYHLENINESEAVVSIEKTIQGEDEKTPSMEAKITGSYDRTSMLVRDASVKRIIHFGGQKTVDGKLVDISVEIHSSREYSRSDQ